LPCGDFGFVVAAPKNHGGGVKKPKASITVNIVISHRTHLAFSPTDMRAKIGFLGRFALMVAVLPLASLHARAADPLAAGKEFVELLASQDFAGAVKRYDATMAAALPELKLREAWEAVQSDAGRFQRQIRAQTEKVKQYDVVLVTCQFERATLDTKVVFDSDGKVAGLFFLPATLPAGWFGSPSYARTNLFREKEVHVGGGQWILPGTLTLPIGPGPWPAVVLVHGSGALDRDETVGANKPFRDLAWGLASKGVAVLRYEKRTKEYVVAMATIASKITLKEETIDDAVSAVELLRKTEGIDQDKIFVLGHSLGGLAAPRIAEIEPAVAGLVILAGPTRPMDVVVLDQARYLISIEAIPSQAELDKEAEIEKQMKKVRELGPAEASSSELIFGVAPVYWLDLKDYDQVATASSLKRPMLILQGGRDYQVTEADFDGWKKGLGSRADMTFKLYPDLNHLFITGIQKSRPSEYYRHGHVSELVVSDIAEWIRKQPGER
jgi:dienelactone hydrolase